MDIKEVRKKILDEEKKEAEKLLKYRDKLKDGEDLEPDYEYEHPVMERLLNLVEKLENLLISRGVLKENPYDDKSIAQYNSKVRTLVGAVIGLFLGSIIIAIIHPIAIMISF